MLSFPGMKLFETNISVSEKRMPFSCSSSMVVALAFFISTFVSIAVSGSS